MAIRARYFKHLFPKLQSYVMNEVFVKYDIPEMEDFFGVNYRTIWKAFKEPEFLEWHKSIVDILIERKKKELRLASRVALEDVDVRELRKYGSK
mgnify:CR=1 FL=1